MTETKPALASENCHYYTKQGEPCYEVEAKNGQMRPTTLRDARKLSLVPSVTTILSCAARPGLEAWKARTLLEAALTLPKLPDETLDSYATRVIEDSKEQGRKAAERGTELHAAIEQYIIGNVDLRWFKHLEKLEETLKQYGIDIQYGKPEHSFASPLGYAGKVDWHNDEIVCDFKSKANLDAPKLAWPEHCYQLAAYSMGLPAIPTKPIPTLAFRRLINVFVGIDDCEVRIHEWPEKDSYQAWAAFNALFSFWKIKNNWNGRLT